MLRRIVAITSLLIALAIGCSWVRSWFSVDAVMIGDAKSWRMAWHGGGRVNITTGVNRGLPLDFRLGGSFEPVVSGSDIAAATFPVKGHYGAGCDILDYDYTKGPSFDYRHDVATPPTVSTMTTVTFPYWIPFAALCVYPLFVFFGWRRRRRRADLGQCPHCGYDLRGTIAAGLCACPECGIDAVVSERIASSMR